MTRRFSFQDIVCDTGEIVHTYSSYLLTNHWKTFRAKIFIAREKTCEICKKKLRQYQVHHKTYVRIGFESDEDVMLLCVHCHRQLHEGKSASRKRRKKRNKNKEKSVYCGKYYNQKFANKKSKVIITKLNNNNT